MKRAVDEDRILRPVDPAINDDNDWPIFPIISADVHSDDAGELENLLFASEALPLSITGRLDRLDRREQSHLLERDLLPTSIRISHVQKFAYGQFDDGEIAFWAAGKAGWFEIRPSRQYRPIYKAMCEAINILYFTADFYRGMKPKQLKQTPAAAVFSQYAKDLPSKCPDQASAKSSFFEHRATLRGLMADGKENINWRQTDIFKLLDREPSEVASAGFETPKGTPDRPSDDDDDLPYRLAGKGKSALRLKPGSQSGKAAARQAAMMGSDGHNSNVDRDGSPPLKRKLALDPAVKPRKRGRPRRQGTDDPASGLEEHTDDATSISLGEVPEVQLPLRSVANAPKPALPNTIPPPRNGVEIVESRMPSFAANLPGDAWLCVFDGCSHKVFAASTQDSRELIIEHYKKHAHECQAAIDVVQREERPYLPVSHLIKRIREMASQPKPAPAQTLDASGPAPGRSKPKEPPWLKDIGKYPQPIKQKY